MRYLHALFVEVYRNARGREITSVNSYGFIRDLPTSTNLEEILPIIDWRSKLGCLTPIYGTKHE
jgi:hypothetical protein